MRVCVCGGGYGSIRAEDRLLFSSIFFCCWNFVCVSVCLLKERERNLVMVVLMEEDDIFERNADVSRWFFG